MGVEFELKYKATAVQQKQIAAAFAPMETTVMETTYYDTADRALSAAHMTLRRRRENGVCICAVKTPEKNGARGEWEVEGEEILAALTELCKLGCPAELLALTKTGVEALCGAQFVRRTALIRTETFTAELALDEGVLVGGEKKQALCEVELELKSGSEDALVAFASRFAEEFSLEKEPRSKFRRALALTTGE